MHERLLARQHLATRPVPYDRTKAEAKNVSLIRKVEAQISNHVRHVTCPVVQSLPDALLLLTNVMWWDVSMRPALRTYATQARGAESIVRRAGGGGRDRSRSILPTAPLPPYRIWLKNGAKAFKYPKPRQGPHWLAETPFPLNPTFSPQPPVHQSVRDDMWQLHTQDAKQWTVRALSAKFRVSMERTEAILRLKALEDMYTQQVRQSLCACLCMARMRC